MSCPNCEGDRKPGDYVGVDKDGRCTKCGKPITVVMQGLRGYIKVPSLEEASKLISGERQDDYGAPEDSFQKIADAWDWYLNNTSDRLTKKDVAAMMILLKLARGTKKRDNWIDIIGYAAIAADKLED